MRHDYGIYVNDKRVLRICRARDIWSTVKCNNHSCTRRARNPQYLAENLLDSQFYADKPNEKWLTDVMKLKWYEGIEAHKLYLSAILDLCDRCIVAYTLSEHNDNTLVFKTFDQAVKATRTHIICFTVTDDANIQAERSTRNSYRQEWYRACPVLPTVSTIALWKVSGAF